MSSEYKITLEEQSPLDEGAERAGKVGMLALQSAFANAYRHGYEDGQKAATPAEHNETSAILAAAEAPTRIADLESRTPANEVQNAKRSWNVCPLCGELADVPDECMPGARFKCSDCGTDLYAEYFTDGTWQLLLASDVDGPECPRHKVEGEKHGIDAISCAVAMIDAELAEPGPEIAECQPSAVDVLRRVRKSIRETLPAARDAGSVWKIEEERVYAIIDDELATLGATITDTSKPTKPAAIEPTPQDLTDPKKPTKPVDQ